MGYFDGLVNSGFKKDGSGRTVYYPWGIFGQGRVLENAGTERTLRAFLLKYYIAVIVLVPALVVFTGAGYLVAVLAAVLFAWFVFTTRTLLSQCPVTEERLTAKETCAAMGAANNEAVLWLLLLTSCAFVAFGAWLALRPGPATAKLAGALCILFFGAGAGLMGYMLKLKSGEQGTGKK